LIEEGLDEGYEHPKVIETVELVKKHFSENPDSRILIFANYRASVNIIVEKINEISSIDMPRIFAAGLIGHKHKRVLGGLSSKQQKKLLKQFEEGIVNTLVATSVAEQGLDVIDCDLVIFYDGVPNQIRRNQRQNRTGKQRRGRVITLITKGTADERYFWMVNYLTLKQ
jgi:Fanconi anemia group M protein